MSIFVLAKKAVKPKTKNIQSVSLFFAGALIVIALLQLFSFEEFPARLIEIGIPEVVASLLATFIVSAEVFALPFALGLPLSPAFRIISMCLGWVVVTKLLFIAILENFTSPFGHDAVFGATLPLPVGMWAICAVLALGVLGAWTSWGLWPFRKK